MVFYPSIGDVALICGKAYDSVISFKRAPIEFRTISSELQDLHYVLEDINVQSQRSWSPLARDKQRATNLKRFLSATDEELQELQGALNKYNSLGSDAPKLAERARYITVNFDPIREKLRQRRQELNTQLSLSQSDVLAKILKIVYERAEDERKGKRRSVVCGPDKEDDDAFTDMSQDLQRRNIPKQDIDTFKPDIEAYIEELRQDERISGSELGPYYSVSEIGTNVSVLGMPTSSSLKDGLLDPVAQFHGITIRDVSYRTIFNPHIKPNMVRKPNTFDVWGLGAKCLQLQQTLTRDLSRIPEDEGQHFESILRQLSYFEPFMILTLADSSTDNDYWSRMQAVREFEIAQCAKVLSKNTTNEGLKRGEPYGLMELGEDTWPYNLSFDEVGDTLLRLLTALHNEHKNVLIRSTAQHDKSSLQNSPNRVATPNHETKAPTAPTNSKRGSIFSLRRPRSTGVTSSASKIASIDLPSGPSSVEQQRRGYRPCTKYSPIRIDRRTLRSPEMWDLALEVLLGIFVGIIAGSTRITRSGFESDLRRIVSRWEQNYDRERMPHTPRSELEGVPLLVEWLLSIQKLDAAKGRGLSALSRELSFPYISADRLRFPHGVCVGIDENLYDARNEGFYLNPYFEEIIKIHDKSIYAHNTEIVAARYPCIVSERMEKALSDGWDECRTDREEGVDVNLNSYTRQWERPLQDQQLGSLSVDSPSA